MIKVRRKLRIQYYLVLEHFVKNQLDNKYTAARLEQYRIKFFKDLSPIEGNNKIDDLIKALLNNPKQPWRKKYPYFILCDIALLLMDYILISKAANEMMKYMTQKQGKQLKVLLRVFEDEYMDITSFPYAKGLIMQYINNRNFIQQPIKKYLVTANMSAGKSTLINALIGKPLARTSQEVCTGNICHLYNKPFEDNHIHLDNDTFSMNASKVELASLSWDKRSKLASYFRGVEEIKQRLCLIDTPGVNSAINRNHGRISREALKSEDYDKVIYILNANKLGTDEEIAHIKWISENVPRDKVIFVLNKLDNFKVNDDDISSSIEGVRKDLVNLGFENPIICPISAYFALLIKMKSSGDEMTEDEIDEYELYTKKFKKSMYDLSKYYEDVHEDENDSEIISISKKCGLYGLEKLLLGGAL